MNAVYEIDFPPNLELYNKLLITVLWTTSLCSTLFIVNMTFDRFYSIIRPHKAASFNTVKRAKITIVCIVIFSIIFNIPHFFITTHEGRQSVPFGYGMEYIQGQMYYWVSLFINFAVPFVLLLVMNSVIIHTLRKRSALSLKYESRMKDVSQDQNQDHNEGQKSKSSERQIFAILLLVTFGFLILTTPAYAFFLYVKFVNYGKSAEKFAEFYLFYNFAHKSYYTNYGSNFFFYVISGKKFRTDLLNLFAKARNKKADNSVDGSSRSSNVELEHGESRIYAITT